MKGCDGEVEIATDVLADAGVIFADITKEIFGSFREGVGCETGRVVSGVVAVLLFGATVRGELNALGEESAWIVLGGRDEREDGDVTIAGSTIVVVVGCCDSNDAIMVDAGVVDGEGVVVGGWTLDADVVGVGVAVAEVDIVGNDFVFVARRDAIVGDEGGDDNSGDVVVAEGAAVEGGALGSGTVSMVLGGATNDDCFGVVTRIGVWEDDEDAVEDGIGIRRDVVPVVSVHGRVSNGTDGSNALAVVSLDEPPTDCPEEVPYNETSSAFSSILLFFSFSAIFTFSIFDSILLILKGFVTLCTISLAFGSIFVMLILWDVMLSVDVERRILEIGGVVDDPLAAVELWDCRRREDADTSWDFKTIGGRLWVLDGECLSSVVVTWGTRELAGCSCLTCLCWEDDDNFTEGGGICICVCACDSADDGVGDEGNCKGEEDIDADDVEDSGVFSVVETFWASETEVRVGDCFTEDKGAENETPEKYDGKISSESFDSVFCIISLLVDGGAKGEGDNFADCKSSSLTLCCVSVPGLRSVSGRLAREPLPLTWKGVCSYRSPVLFAILLLSRVSEGDCRGAGGDGVVDIVFGTLRVVFDGSAISGTVLTVVNCDISSLFLTGVMTAVSVATEEIRFNDGVFLIGAVSFEDVVTLASKVCICSMASFNSFCSRGLRCKGLSFIWTSMENLTGDW